MDKRKHVRELTRGIGILQLIREWVYLPASKLVTEASVKSPFTAFDAGLPVSVLD
jgi:hypothetical protein